MGALSDQDYLARLYISNYFGRRRFVQVCVRPLRCRQRFRYRFFRSQPDRRLNDSSGHFDESRTVACRQRFSCTRCFRIGEGRLYRSNIAASDITDDGDTGCHWPTHARGCRSRSSADENSKSQTQTAETRCRRQQIPAGRGSEGLRIGRVRCISLGIQPANRLPRLGETR